MRSLSSYLRPAGYGAGLNGELGEEPIDETEPRAVLWGEGEFEASYRASWRARL